MPRKCWYGAGPLLLTRPVAKGIATCSTTNDITGGNSGSPVLNAKGEVIGAAFDGNIHSLGGAFAYDGSINRTVVASTAAATEAFVKVYGQQALVDELLGKPFKKGGR